jgi:hypothetical protein
MRYNFFIYRGRKVRDPMNLVGKVMEVSREAIVVSRKIIMVNGEVIMVSREVILGSSKIIMVVGKVMAVSREVIVGSSKIIMVNGEVIMVSRKIIVGSSKMIMVSRKVIVVSRNLNEVDIKINEDGILMGYKHLRRNGLDAWWTVDGYGSIKQRTNVYALTGSTLGGLWTGMDRSNKEQTSTP